MNVQTSLFDPPASAPFQKHSATSRDAAKKILRDSDRTRMQVLDAIEKSVDGLTDEEIQIALEMNPSTQRPRRVELIRMELVKDSGRKRSTTSGRWATVWIRTSNA